MSASAESTTQGTTRHLVLCDMSGETYGIDIGSVDTVIRYQPITKVPCMPHFVEGVVNLRGSIIPVVDLRKRFGLTIKPVQHDSRIVVVKAKQLWVGLIVDAVTQTKLIAASQIEEPGSLVVDVKHRFIEAIGKLDDQIIILLNLDECLTSTEVDDACQAVDQIQTQRDGE